MVRLLATALILLAALAALAAPPPARAGGLGPGGDVGPRGVTVPGHASRYVALFHRGGTLVARIDRRGGRLVAYASLRRRVFVTAAAWDGSPTGLSGDGRTLVLSGDSGRFTVLDTRSMHVMDHVWLEGELTLHALSADGGTLFLNANGAVLAYDVASRRLRPHPVATLDEPGMPLSHTTSRDGRWAYTLYEGERRGPPLVLALDTANERARTFPLEPLTGRDNLYGLALRTRPDGKLAVHESKHGPKLLVIDPDPDPDPIPPRRETAATTSAGQWPITAAGLALLALLAYALRTTKRHQT